MKKLLSRILPLLLLTSVLLSGCGINSPENTTAAPDPTAPPPVHSSQTLPPETSALPPETTTETTVTTTVTTTEPPSLLDGAEPAGELGNTFYVEAEGLSGFMVPKILPFGEEHLLAYSYSGTDLEYATHLRLISLWDGSLTAQTTIDSDYSSVYANGSEIAVCLPMDGKILILDSELSTLTEYDLGSSSFPWYMSSDLTTLYCADWYNGLIATDLATGETRNLTPGAMDLYACTSLPTQLTLSYIDGETQRYALKSLDLTTGELIDLPSGDDFSHAVRAGDVWLVNHTGEWESYSLFGPFGERTFKWTGNTAGLDPVTGLFFTVDNLARNICLYTDGGSFVSACQLPMGNCFVSTELIWSPLWNGYFFTDNTPQGTKLVFWDTSLSVPGEDFEFSDPQPDIPEGVTAAPELYERAEELGERFGLEILIADQCALDYNSFSASAQNDYVQISSALYVLENALSAYPEGFISQLSYGHIQCIRIELITELTPKDTTAYSGSYSAFAHEGKDRYLVVIDTVSVVDSTIFHEFSHIIDKRLTWDSDHREGALFSEDAWLDLQPEGFRYANTYGETGIDIYDPAYDGWFVKPYSRRYPTEDRATLLEEAMIRNDYIFTSNPGLRKKLEFYALCIRDCFNTDGWPEVTRWEAALNQ